MGTLTIQEHADLAPLTTLGVGGRARFFAHVHSEGELTEALLFRDRHNLPVFVLGGGSNLLVRDEGFDGLVLQLDIRGEMQILQLKDHVECDVPAGSPWDDFVLETCNRDLSGVECLAGIPGLTGGTPVQNVGAYGQEVAQTISSVRAYDLQTSSFRRLTAAECQFGYRSSLFNRDQSGRFLVTAVTFRLKKSGKPSLSYAELRQRFPHADPHPKEVYEGVREIRRAKGMLITPGDPDSRSAGSFFKNPVVPEQIFSKISAQAGSSADVPHWQVSSGMAESRLVKLAAAWLVQAAGFPKGYVEGRAGISTRHALALVNRGGATFADIARLRDLIRSAVMERFEIALEQEPVELGPRSLTSHQRTASRPMLGSFV